jgi:cytidylate kinase
MSIICISRSAYSGGEVLAQKLAEKLGYACLSREELVTAATKTGIRVGKLEMAAVKPRDFCERLAREREHYLAFSSAYLCDRALEGGLVYHGRTGHLLLSGINDVLRVRVTSSHEHRVQAAARALGIDRHRALRYVEQVDEDWRQWARTLYGRSWEDVLEYDMTVNLENVNADNVAATLVTMSQLPDFQMTPASLQALRNLQLGSRARLMLARDDRISCNRLTVRANDGVLTISYLPREWHCAQLIPQALEGLEGVRELHTTMASTNILWIQERFDPGSESFREVVEIATKWDAAVEAVRLLPGAGDGDGPAGAGDADRRGLVQGGLSLQELLPVGSAEAAAATGPRALGAGESYDGGVEDDDAETPTEEDGGLTRTMDELARVGRSGGRQVVYGRGDELLSSIDRLSTYTLAVVGDVFLSKPVAARKRLTRELQGLLGERLKIPVVTAEELKTRYLFSGREAARAGGYLALVGAIFVLMLTHQLPLLRFLSGDWGGHSTLGRVAVSVAVFLIVPLVAFAYGNVSKTLLKLIKME